MENILISIFALSLMYHTYTDLKEMLLYDWVNVIILVCGLIYAVRSNEFLNAAYGFGAGLVIMLIIYLISKGGLGEGDVKLVPCLGIWLGFEKTFVCLFLAFVFGAVLGLIVMFIRKQKLNTPIPFGPFLCLSALVSFFYGSELLSLYWNYINYNL